MSFDYLVMTKEELVELFGEPIDTTPVSVKQLLAEGWPVDENGKDMTNTNYGNRGFHHSEETKQHLSRVITGSHPDQSYRTPEISAAQSKMMTAKGNPNWKGGVTKDPNYERDKMRRWRAKQVELYGPDWRKTKKAA